MITLKNIGLGLLLCGGSVSAEVSFDHSSVVSPAYRGQTLTGTMSIPAKSGTQLGGNLFHSFDNFNIQTGETVTFTNIGAQGTINNVIGRVTGGLASNIDGVLSSTIPNADLYLINPNGMVLGSHGQIDVQGTFHASTAAQLNFADGGHFDVFNPATTVLTMAAPAAFGFLESAPIGTIDANGIPQSKQNLDLVAGNIRIGGYGYLYVEHAGGEIRLVALQGQGDVSVKPTATGGLPMPTHQPLSQGGDITIDAGYMGIVGDGGGRITAWGGALSLLNSSIVGILNTDSTDVRSMDGINIHADTLRVDSNSQITNLPSASGRAANIRINSNALAVSDGGVIQSLTVKDNTGDAGNIRITTGDLLLDGKQQTTYIASEAILGSSGNAGEVKIDAGTITITNNGRISSLTQGEGHAGNVLITADKLTVNGENSHGERVIGIVSDATAGSGNAGKVTVTAGELNILSGGRISSLTTTSGYAGDVLITTDKLTIDGKNSPFPTGITSDTEGSGNAHTVTVHARNLTLLNGGQISSESTTQANGGDVIITATLINVLNQSLITARNTGLGEAGKIVITANDALHVERGSAVTVESKQGNAGDIAIYPSKLLYVFNSKITTTAGGGQGNGGNIVIEHPEFTVLNNSDIIANALQGNGGNIDVITDFFLQSTNSVVQASSQFGLQGTVSIQSANSNIAGSIAILTGGFTDLSAVLQEGCSKRAKSSFVVANTQNTVLASPDTTLSYLPASLADCVASF